MKLYVFSKLNNSKIYLNVAFPHRQAMRNYFGGDWFVINDGYSYSVNETYAEAEQNYIRMLGSIDYFYFNSRFYRSIYYYDFFKICS